MIKKNISAGQRKYFEGRIIDACEEQISDIKYVNAAKIVEITKREHILYLKNLKVNIKLKKYSKICREIKDIEDELLPIVKTLREALPNAKQGWDHSVKYTTISSCNTVTYADDMEKAFPQDRQVGGSHYKNFHIQPYEFISKNNLSFFQGCVVKYVCRYLSKNKIEDLQKIIHYCELEILKLKDTKKK